MYFILAMLKLHCCAGFSLAVASRGYPLDAVNGLLVAVASLIAEQGFWVPWASAVVAWAIEHRLSHLGCTGLVAPWCMGSSWTGDQTHVFCIGRQIFFVSHQGSPHACSLHSRDLWCLYHLVFAAEGCVLFFTGALQFMIVKGGSPPSYKWSFSNVQKIFFLLDVSWHHFITGGKKRRTLLFTSLTIPLGTLSFSFRERGQNLKTSVKGRPSKCFEVSLQQETWWFL